MFRILSYEMRGSILFTIKENRCTRGETLGDGALFSETFRVSGSLNLPRSWESGGFDLFDHRGPFYEKSQCGMTNFWVLFHSC